ncbi:hypothetical protein [Variovorax sp. YR216]|uniref:hypothetical protein n=1 Tax=Variovorax sp. YR216 TaxID=1882828 RepID=UPI00089CEB10|nr:hypothetical protein [Variovorax sp. YR216]SEA76522.1 hypothetical protein SAMN05444680_103484 [Variovorax sp. YR216]
MSVVQQKSAEVLEQAESLRRNLRISSKRVDTLQAQFALHGHELKIEHLAGRNLYVVSRSGQSHMFSHLNDVEAFLRQVTEISQ